MYVDLIQEELTKIKCNLGKIIESHFCSSTNFFISLALFYPIFIALLSSDMKVHRPGWMCLGCVDIFVYFLKEFSPSFFTHFSKIKFIFLLNLK